MGILHKIIFHIIYQLVLISELAKLAQYNTEAIVTIGMLAAAAGALAVEYFFLKNKYALSRYVKNPNWSTARKILFYNNPERKEI